MTLKNLQDASIDSLVKANAEAAAAHGETDLTGDYEKGNREYDVLAAIYRELRARGHHAQLYLLELLNDGNPYVRGWAASHSLEFAPEQGELVLTELTRCGGITGFNAEMTLEEWRKGSLKFP